MWKAYLDDILFSFHKYKEGCCMSLRYYACPFQMIGIVAALLIPLLWTVAIQADDWPQWRGPNRDGVWAETGILPSFPAQGLKARWRAKVGPGWSSPVVAKGRVYLTDSELKKPKAKERV